jgi:hypothetical protein
MMTRNQPEVVQAYIKTWRAILMTAKVTVVGSAIWNWQLVQDAIRQPLRPDFEHLVPFNDHGNIHYLTNAHSEWMSITTLAMMLCFGLVFIAIATDTDV